jgi:hypothetical protein
VARGQALALEAGSVGIERESDHAVSRKAHLLVCQVTQGRAEERRANNERQGQRDLTHHEQPADPGCAPVVHAPSGAQVVGLDSGGEPCGGDREEQAGDQRDAGGEQHHAQIWIDP